MNTTNKIPMATVKQQAIISTNVKQDANAILQQWVNEFKITPQRDAGIIWYMHKPMIDAVTV